MRAVRCLTGLGALVVCAGHVAPPAAAQAAAPYQSGKASFVEALVAFTTAMAGTFGDEGPALRDSLDAMQRTLERWDGSIAEYEAAARREPPGVDTHVTLAAVYLDRGLPTRALPELDAAVGLAPSEPALHALQGLVHDLAGARARAIEAYERAVRLDGGEPMALYELSRLQRADGRREAAADAGRLFRDAMHARLVATGAAPATPSVFARPALFQARGAGPVFPLTRYADGFRLLRTGAYAEAIEAFRRGAETDPLRTGATGGTGGRAAARGRAALRRGALREALELLGTAVASDPRSSEAARLLGMAFWADERYDMAALHLRAAVALRPRDERARLALADVLVSAEETDAAERVLLDTLDVLPESGQALFRLGRLYHLTEQYPAAIDAFERAVALEPFVGLAGLYELIGRTSALEQDAAGTIQAYRRQIDADPNDADTHRALAGTFLDEDRYEEALTELLAALLVDPGDAAAAGQVARVYLERGDYADAVAVARYALRFDEHDREARYTLATGLVRLGRRDEGAAAIEAFGRLQQAELAREREAYELDALRREAIVSLEQGDPARAVDLRRAMVERQPGAAVRHAELGEALLLAGQPEEAVASFERALSLDPEADVHRQLAEAYGALGRTEKRREHLDAYERTKEARLRAGAFR